MQSPFRKLVRISIVLFATVLLCNFFAYYLVNKKSAENEELIAGRSLAGRQQTLSQVIAKQAALITGTFYGENETRSLKDSMATTLALFKNQQELLLKRIAQTKTPLPAHVFKIRILFSYINPYYTSIESIGQEIIQDDSVILRINKRLYLQRLMESENKFLPIMRDITNEFTVYLNEKNTEASAIEVGKFLSLVVAIICLIILVLEPAFKKGETNFRDLQKAQNELQVEKKHLDSLLQSQTNYLIRIDRKGNFSYANQAFLKAFGYKEEEVMNKPFLGAIFPKDLARCRDVAEECWNNPGKIVKLLIRKPFKNNKAFVWTDWELLALNNEHGQVSEIQGIGLNVTDKVIAQEVKEEAIQTLSYAMSYARMGSWKVDFETQEIKLSNEFRELLVMEEDILEKLSLDAFIEEFVVPEDFQTAKDEFGEIFLNRDNVGYESSFSFRVINREGWMRYLFLKGKVV
ncbi:MAG TPA: PAS domain-containing protein, partial [Puia sp.]